jgi:muconolactone delta-isomerase
LRSIEEETMAGKFLVLWKLELSRMTPGVVQALMRQQDYGARLMEAGKLEARYHVVGSHGGAWIYDVDSNEELDNLLAQAPVYNMSSYQVLPLAEMLPPAVSGAAEAE